MTESDKKYYESVARHDEKSKKALSKIQNRGDVSVEWHKTNTLTKETLPEFKALMKKADKEWEQQN